VQVDPLRGIPHDVPQRQPEHGNFLVKPFNPIGLLKHKSGGLIQGGTVKPAPARLFVLLSYHLS